jgi:hypothetical protein
MRASRLILAITALTFTVAAAEPLKVLIIDGQNNHKWDITTPVLRHALEGCGAFLVEVSTTPPKGFAGESWSAWHPKFSDFAVVVSNYNGEPWPASVRSEFDAYMKAGGGFVSVHAANTMK